MTATRDRDDGALRLWTGVVTIALGVVLAGGAFALYLELAGAAAAGGAVELSAPLAFLVDRVVAPLLSSPAGVISPARLAGTVSVVLWVAMGLGLVLAWIGLRAAVARRE